MKKFSSFILFTVALLAGSGSFAQSMDEVIDQHLAAIGGKDNWRKVDTVKTEASISTQGMDIPVIIYQVHNKAMKQEINVMNMTGYKIVTTDAGWNYMPFMGQAAPEQMAADELALEKEGLDIQGDLLDYKDKGHVVTLLGKEAVDGADCHKLKLTRKSGSEALLYIDAKSLYMVRTSTRVKANGQEMDLVTNYSNFQKLPLGIVVPMTMENTGLPAPLIMTKVEVNPVIDNAIFTVK